MKKTLTSEGGFVLLTALIACLILLALTTLMVNMSTRDLQASSENVGTKRAMLAADAGLLQMMREFDPDKKSDSTKTAEPVDPSLTTPTSNYDVAEPNNSKYADYHKQIQGYQIAGGRSFGNNTYDVMVTGRSTTHKSAVRVEAGIGYISDPDPFYH